MFASSFSYGLFWEIRQDAWQQLRQSGCATSVFYRWTLEPAAGAPSPRVERKRIVLEARPHLRSMGINQYGTLKFLRDLKGRGLSVMHDQPGGRAVPPGGARCARQRAIAGCVCFRWSRPRCQPHRVRPKVAGPVVETEVPLRGLRLLRATPRGAPPLPLKWHRTPKRAPCWRSWSCLIFCV